MGDGQGRSSCGVDVGHEYMTDAMRCAMTDTIIRMTGVKAAGELVKAGE